MDTNGHEWGRDRRGMMTVIPTCFAVRDSGHVASMESLACGERWPWGQGRATDEGDLSRRGRD